MGVQVLCCPEGILGGLADYARRPDEIAIDVQNGQLERLLTPIASETVTTILGAHRGRRPGAALQLRGSLSEGRGRRLVSKTSPGD